MSGCSIVDCHRAHLARGYCGTHYARWRVGRTIDAPIRPTRQQCEVDGCGRTHLALGYCAGHYQRVRTHGDPGSPEIHDGGRYSYSAAHLAVYEAHGPARDHQCRECGDRADEWAYDHSDPDELRDPNHGAPYSLDVDRYRPLCKSCHAVFDEHPFTVSVGEPAVG